MAGVVRSEGKLAVPDTKDQVPVCPAAGELPVNEKPSLLQFRLLPVMVGDPTAETFCITISSVEAGQGLLLTVHLNVAELPAARFETVVFLNVGEVMLADPETRDQTPDPVTGAVAAKVKVPLLH
jgi:hypothetical protein